MKPRHSDFSRSQRATERVQTPWIPWISVYPKLSYSEGKQSSANLISPLNSTSCTLYTNQLIKL